MIYGPERMKTLADDIRDFLKENHLEADYFGRLCSGQPAVFKLPAMETVIDNGSLRYELICYLSYRTSLIADEARNEWGHMLVAELDGMEAPPVKGENAMEQAARAAAGLLKELDYFKYAEYMRAGDHEADVVRRIYADLMVPEKRSALCSYFQSFPDTAMEGRIREVAAALKELGKSYGTDQGFIRR